MKITWCKHFSLYNYSFLYPLLVDIKCYTDRYPNVRIRKNRTKLDKYNFPRPDFLHILWFNDPPTWIFDKVENNDIFPNFIVIFPLPRQIFIESITQCFFAIYKRTILIFFPIPTLNFLFRNYFKPKVEKLRG